MDVRAAASEQKFAMVTPVTNPTDEPLATGNISVIHFSTTVSIFALTGLVARRHAFWSHALAIQLAASAAGCEPPITKP